MRDIRQTVSEQLDELIERALRGDRFEAPRDVQALLDRADEHGLLGVVEDVLGDDMRARALSARRSVARELDHAAHLAALRRIDVALCEAGVPSVALKGALLGARLYPRPWTRATTDTDLLVGEDMLSRSDTALRGLGYIAAQGEDEERFRREHFHLHYSHPEAPPLELHFHAFRGFGHTLPATPLIARRNRAADFTAIGVLAPEDEIVYLAVHAAAHRFIRLGWLYDLRLLVERTTEAQLVDAASRAHEMGYRRVVAFAADLLVERLGMSAGRVAPLRSRRGATRSSIARACVREPVHPLARAGTRFVYSVALCDSARATIRYAVTATLGYARRVSRAPP